MAAKQEAKAKIAKNAGFPRPFGPYLLEKNLSRGGMGEVFLAVPRGVRRRCVIKTIRTDLTGDEEFVGRFTDEAKIMVRIVHDNIIRVFDCGKIGPEFYIAMEYVHGRDLGDVLDRAFERGQPLPKELGLYITQGLVRGLDYAHNLKDERGRPMNLVHRDISPQNVLVGFDGSIKLIDFGLARTELLPARTQGALAVGKYGYMPPEQARHEKIDGRADIYAAGVMLFEVFTGDRLVDEQDQATLWSRVLNPNHRPPSASYPGVPREIDDLVLKSVASKPDDRFQNAQEVLDFVHRMKTRVAKPEEFIEYLRFLYPRVDFSAPALPDFGEDEEKNEFEESEKSVVIALSEEGAKSVFGRGELPIQFTRQLDMRKLRAELEAEKKRRAKGKDAPDNDVVTGELTVGDRSTFGESEATMMEARDDSRTAIAQPARDDPPSYGTLVDYSAPHHATQKIESDPRGSPLKAGKNPLGASRPSGHQFPDEEATVMMAAPSLNAPGWPEKVAPKVTNEGDPDYMEPTRLAAPRTQNSPAPEVVPPDKKRKPAKHEDVEEEDSAKASGDKKPRVEKRREIREERREPPPRDGSSSDNTEAPPPAIPKPNYLLLGIIFIGMSTIILLLLILILRTD
ncbi:MAG: serine/threonine protein kinase [Deltaproteobacteria bacterium]|nr:serine/threonine protein kinase [Deltaproteobacteria bacterium]